MMHSTGADSDNLHTVHQVCKCQMEVLGAAGATRHRFKAPEAPIWMPYSSGMHRPILMMLTPMILMMCSIVQTSDSSTGSLG